jgi:hypothetical protein
VGRDRVTSEEKIARYEVALQRIVEWADTYLARTGRRPDLLKVIALLQGTGISFDSVVAEIGRSPPETEPRLAKRKAGKIGK